MTRKPEEIKKGLECRRRLMDSLCDCLCSKCQFFIPDYTRTEINRDAIAYIQQLEAQVPKWISVEERQPEHFENVLVCTKHEMLLCHYDGDEWVINYDGEYAGYDYEITHWMPLPEGPPAG